MINAIVSLSRKRLLLVSGVLVTVTVAVYIAIQYYARSPAPVVPSAPWTDLEAEVLGAAVIRDEEQPATLIAGLPAPLPSELVVLSRNAPTIFYRGRNGPEGLEYELTQAFAAHLGVSVRYVFFDSLAEILQAVRSDRGHLAAAGIARTAIREKTFAFGPAYQMINQQVVCRRNLKLPRSPADLVGRSVAAISASSYEETLRAWRSDHPGLTWQSIPDKGTEELLEWVWRKKLDCVLADSNIVAVNRRYYPQLRVAFDATDGQVLAWILGPAAAQPLAVALEEWMSDFITSGKLAAVTAKYYEQTEKFDYVEMRTLVKRIKKVLPKYRQLFEDAARKYDLPWTLLAAQAYQESHWDPQAQSRTGVRGMMMLTEAAAADLGVVDRLDVAQNIDGGARYLAGLRARLPDSVPEEQRVSFALAAYNMGMGHLWDARVLTKRLKRNPDRWEDVFSVLPLLSKRRHYATLERGYARGFEAIHYITRIHDYEDVIRLHAGLHAVGAREHGPVANVAPP